MGGILRLVQFSCPVGGVEALRELVSKEVVPINMAYGSESCRVLHSQKRPLDFAIASVWPNAQTLAAMRSQPEYQALVARIRARTETDLSETIYEVLA